MHSVLVYIFFSLYECSQQPVAETVQIQVNRISMHDYEVLHYDKEQLKEAGEYLFFTHLLHTDLLLLFKYYLI